MPQYAAITEPLKAPRPHIEPRSWPLAAWGFPLLGAAILIVLDVESAAAESSATLPSIEVVRLDEGPLATYEIGFLAPPDWRNGQVRRELLRRAALVAEQHHAQCFAIDRASLDRNVLYVPLRKGHMTISASANAREWRRYWQMYQHILDAPGIQLGFRSGGRSGERVIEGHMKIRLCPSDQILPGKIFKTEKLAPR